MYLLFSMLILDMELENISSDQPQFNDEEPGTEGKHSQLGSTSVLSKYFELTLSPSFSIFSLILDLNMEKPSSNQPQLNDEESGTEGNATYFKRF